MTKPGDDPSIPDQTKAKEHSFWQEVVDGIDKLTLVRVATLLTQVTVSVDNGLVKDVQPPAGEIDALVTTVNLVHGDQTNTIAPNLAGNATLLAFHQGIVEKAVKVFPDNLRELLKLAEDLFAKLEHKS